MSLSFLYKGLKNLKLDLPVELALPAALAVGMGLALAGSVWIPRVLERGGKPNVERVFLVLQVATACMVAFAHGSNDVANAIGPLAAVYGVVTEGILRAQVEVPFWILALGGTGIVLGLALYGHKVILTIGKKITEMTPSRGFCAEFAAATTILVGSRLGLPLSTTHTLVGSVIGVGLARGASALNGRTIRDILTSWALTVPFTAALTAVFYLLIVFLMA